MLQNEESYFGIEMNYNFTYNHTSYYNKKLFSSNVLPIL